MQSGHAVRYRTAENGEGAFGRDKAFEHNGIFLGACEGSVIIFAVVDTSTASGIAHGSECFKIHGMEHIAAVIVECEHRTVRVPSVTCIPFFYLASGRINAVFVAGSTCFAKEAFNCRREKKPVGIGRIDAAYKCKFLYITVLGLLVEWLPQRIPCTQERLGYICSIHKRLPFLTPQEIVWRLRVYRILVRFQGEFAQFCTTRAFGGTVVGQCQPRRNTGHQATESLHVCNALVASVPIGTDLHKHVFLQSAVGHLAKHRICHVIGEFAPIGTIRVVVFFEMSDILACRQQESAGTEIGGRVFIYHLTGNGFLADRLNIPYRTVFLQRGIL